jgi:fructoselysine-6-P-deglycase FrlB-like protein
MSRGLGSTGIWQDVTEMPSSLQTTLDQSDGFEAVARLLAKEHVRRLVVSGNGASYYAAHALWLTALGSRSSTPEVVAIPAGLLGADGFSWRSGDVLLAISSSGELRDIVEAIEEGRVPGPFVAVTANPESTIGRAASERALVAVASERAVTHTQAFCGGVLACLAIWAQLTNDADLQDAVAQAPSLCAEAIVEAERWAETEFARIPTPTAGIVFGSGPAWAAALETSLLLKEIARIPCEGVETREGAMTAMTGLMPNHVAVSLLADRDAFALEAEQICASRGVEVIRLRANGAEDRRLAPITSFAEAVALSIELALRSDKDPDNPSWTSAYYTTARSKQMQSLTHRRDGRKK